MCVLICVIRTLFCEKALSHWLHWYGFFPVWVPRCRIRLPFSEKVLSHLLHWYSFSPVWIFLCLHRSPFLVKALSHWSHLCSLSPVCIFICIIRWPLCIKRFPRWLHSYGMASEFILTSIAINELLQPNSFLIRIKRLYTILYIYWMRMHCYIISIGICNLYSYKTVL